MEVIKHKLVNKKEKSNKKYISILENFLQIYIYSKTEIDYKYVGGFCKTIATEYLNIKDNDSAEKYFYRSLKALETINDYVGMGHIYLNIIFVAHLKGDEELALKSFKKAKKCFLQAKKYESVNSAYTNLLNFYYYRKDYAKIIDLWNSDKNKIERYNLSFEANSSFVKEIVCQALFKLNKNEQGIELAFTALSDSKKSKNSIAIYRMYRMIALFYKEQGEFKKSLSYYKKYFKYKSLLNKTGEINSIRYYRTENNHYNIVDLYASEESRKEIINDTSQEVELQLSFIEAISFPICILNSDLTYRTCNQSYEHLIQKNKQDLLGHKISFSKDNIVINETLNMIDICLKQGKKYSTKHSLPGENKTYLITIDTFYSDNEKDNKIIISIRDISKTENKKKELVTMTRKLNRIFNSCGTGIFITDSKNEIVSYNNELLYILGIDKSTYEMNKNLILYQVSYSMKVVVKNLKKNDEFTKKQLTYHFWHYGKQKKLLYVKSSPMINNYDEFEGHVYIVEDKTDEHTKKKELETINQHINQVLQVQNNSTIIVLDKDYLVKYSNITKNNSFLISHEEIKIGEKLFSNDTNNKELNKIKKIFNKVITGDIFNKILLINKRNYQLQINPILNSLEQVIGVLFVCHDITEQINKIEYLKMVNLHKKELFGIVSKTLTKPIIEIRNDIHQVIENSKSSKESLILDIKRVQQQSEKVYFYLENILFWANLQKRKSSLYTKKGNLAKYIKQRYFDLIKKYESEELITKISFPEKAVCYYNEELIDKIIEMFVEYCYKNLAFNNEFEIGVAERNDSIILYYVFLKESDIDLDLDKISLNCINIEKFSELENNLLINVLLAKDFVKYMHGRIFIESIDKCYVKISFSLCKNKIESENKIYNYNL